MRRQGEHLSTDQLQRVVQLLQTNLSMPLIAIRLRLSRTCVSNLNQRLKIRKYVGDKRRFYIGDRLIEEYEA